MSKELTAQQFADKLEVTRQLIYYHAKKIPAQDKVYNEDNKLVFTPDQQEFLKSFMTDTLNKEKDDLEDEDLDQPVSLAEEESELNWAKPEFTYDPELAKQIALVMQNEAAAEAGGSLTTDQDGKTPTDPETSLTDPCSASDQATPSQERVSHQQSVKALDKETLTDSSTGTRLSNDKDKGPQKDQESNDKPISDKETIDKVDERDKELLEDKMSNEEAGGSERLLGEEATSQLDNEAAVLEYIQEVVREQLQEKWRQDEEERQMLLEELNTKNQQISDLHQLLDQQQQLMLVTEQKNQQLLDLVNQQSRQLRHTHLLRDSHDWVPSKRWLKYVFND